MRDTQTSKILKQIELSAFQSALCSFPCRRESLMETPPPAVMCTDRTHRSSYGCSFECTPPKLVRFCWCYRPNPAVRSSAVSSRRVLSPHQHPTPPTSPQRCYLGPMGWVIPIHSDPCCQKSGPAPAPRPHILPTHGRNPFQSTEVISRPFADIPHPRGDMGP